MKAKKSLKNKVFCALFSIFFALSTVFSTLIPQTPVYAVPDETTTTATEDETEEKTDEKTDDEQQEETTTTDETVEVGSCSEQIAKMGWLVCSATESAADATDVLQGLLQDFIVVSPLSSASDSPIHSIWEYCRNISNILFVLFFLIVIISQITGLGINNYGIKKILPKIIVAAILVNASFLICQLAVDASNVIGSGLRGLFESVKVATMGADVQTSVSFSDLFAAIGGGAAIAIGGVTLAVEAGAIWMLIPAVVSALVSIFAAIVTMALRHAVIILLVMIAPLAMAANILPNTEQYFKKWKDTLVKMLIFFPAFSLLFGAADLAGWAIIVSSNGSTFMAILGVMVQYVPLFAAWKMLKMSGTLIGSVGEKIRDVGQKSLVAASRTNAESLRNLRRSKFLSEGRTGSAHLMQYLHNRAISTQIETKEREELILSRGIAANALDHYTKKGGISKDGKRAYEMQARKTAYDRITAMDKNNLNRGLAGFGSDYQKYLAGTKRNFELNSGIYSAKIAGKTDDEQLQYLDGVNIVAADDMRHELARGELINYRNAKLADERDQKAMDAHMDYQAIMNGDVSARLHGVLGNATNLSRYNRMNAIMEGDVIDAQYAAASTSYAYDSQMRVIQSKYQKYFDLTAPTQDVVHRLNEFTRTQRSSENIDAAIAGLRILDARGDTDLVREQISQLIQDTDTGKQKIFLGTHASQSLANFLMFDVKDTDPYLRRFGKYINLETARMYNDNDDPSKRRKKPTVDWNEYVNEEYEEYSEYDENGNPVTGAAHRTAHPKRGIKVLLEGTSYKGIERTAFTSMLDGIREASMEIDANGNKVLNIEKFERNQDKVWGSIAPNIISDQFAFLSGSEQIKALAKFITGMKENGEVDWNGIFGDEAASSLTNEQKSEYVQFLNKRTENFLKGHVPNQIAHSKSDMLASIKNLYTMREVMQDDPNVVNRQITKDDQKDYLPKIKNHFANSLNSNTYKGFIKSFHKGYQGDTKANLAELLDPELNYARIFPNAKDADDDGLPAKTEEIDDYLQTGWEFPPEIRAYTNEKFSTYNGNTSFADPEFLQDIENQFAAGTYPGLSEAYRDLDSIKEKLPVAEVYNRIMGNN